MFIFMLKLLLLPLVLILILCILLVIYSFMEEHIADELLDSILGRNNDHDIK